MAFIAGISNSSVIGTALVVSSSGQLGIEMSSARFKRDVHDMGATSDGIMKLRPVTFHYKQDAQGERQYGLIAEEVARLYPELVSYGPDGKPQTVRYLELTAMLLNELQKQNCQLRKESSENQQQARRIEHLAQRMAQQAGRIDQQEARNRQLSAEVAQLKGMFEQARSFPSDAAAGAVESAPWQ